MAYEIGRPFRLFVLNFAVEWAIFSPKLQHWIRNPIQLMGKRLLGKFTFTRVFFYAIHGCHFIYSTLGAEQEKCWSALMIVIVSGRISWEFGVGLGVRTAIRMHKGDDMRRYVRLQELSNWRDLSCGCRCGGGAARHGTRVCAPYFS